MRDLLSGRVSMSWILMGGRGIGRGVRRERVEVRYWRGEERWRKENMIVG